MDRRNFIKYSVLCGISLPLGVDSISGSPGNMGLPACFVDASPVCMFIKPIEKYRYEDIAVMLSEAGFNGVDISFRKGGLIAPETASVELPKAVKAFTDRSLSIPMAVTGIHDPDHPETEKTLKLLADHGIQHYRLGALSCDAAIPFKNQLDNIRKKMEKLASLNERYGLHGAIQNHAGSGFAAAVWDAWWVIRECNPCYLGIQYDVRHAVAEGTGSWPAALQMASEYIRTTCIKDFTWIRDGKNFKPQTVLLGEGIIDFKTYFQIVKQHQIKGPVSIHYEYPLLDKQELTLERKKQIQLIIPRLKRDVELYRKFKTDYT